ncbi:TetR/AcrR family transcriptional regulator [Bifidobacterium sp. ESL0784]|uniref:TetR/AcrR family transcriptional regulator n=1 Tax=Bifidobacterium sp. ESL0784 TaxID=2983231 RepID=UPI0023F81B7A|nr:TetR/AcrR family transcriptional regulator [Bifidobacterium sp. ESL0784]MDF7641482.1 TetR/AcrR family transcriptional regulator [Bifidobacterium sp. ESL0784]
MPNHTTATRRRGGELEDALLDAAWEQIADKGMHGFNYEAVAARAHSSKTVLYRRWPTREGLFAAALRRRLKLCPLQASDTGSLPGDVKALLREASDKRLDTIVALTSLRPLYMGGEHETSENNTGGLHAQANAHSGPSMKKILKRAHGRGELTVDLPERVAALPVNLLCTGIMASGRRPNEADIDFIVDDVFMPVIYAYQSRPDLFPAHANQEDQEGSRPCPVSPKRCQQAERTSKNK